jgi:8-oxo-dGTP pyrophosphatase MutT (NUDIX family)
MMNTFPEINLSLQDTQWPLEYTDHDRQIARAIVFDDSALLYFVRIDRNDEFGKGILIETSGGGVERGEDLHSAIMRELQEELGVTVEILCKLGTVSDYYNLIHRHNINHYYLCRILSSTEKNLTREEIEKFHLSTLQLTYEEAIQEYTHCAITPLGKLIANRELPVLQHAKKIMESCGL